MISAGNIAYVIEDEEYAPHGRRFDVRVHYNWLDYDPADEPHAEWGPTIEAVDIVAVRYFDAAGNDVPAPAMAGEDLAQVVWDLVEAESTRVLEACRQDGYRTGAGESPPWYYPAQHGNAAARIVPRMSSSISTRNAAGERRQFG